MFSHAALAPLILGLPSWSWDTMQTYIHCANTTGEWNDAALQILATQPFVVFEKNHKLFADPVNTSAELKISESCRRVKAINPNVTCLMYVESDWARTFYDLGHWVEAHPSSALQCPGSGDFVNTTDFERWKGGPLVNGSDSFEYHFRAYDFSDAAAREAWVRRVTDTVALGHVDGAFIDGNRGGFGSSVTGACGAAKREAWAAGLNQSVYELAQRLGPDATLISNYPTTEALALCSGGMFERGGSIPDVIKFGKRRCGLRGTPCLLDYHAQYADRAVSSAEADMASWLIGVSKYGYFGIGGGWGGPGPEACSSWLRRYPEYTRPLGEPVSDAVATNATGDPSTTQYTRTFRSGTKVYWGQHLAPEPATRPRNRGACIFWADGTVTGNATQCPPRSTF